LPGHVEEHGGVRDRPPLVHDEVPDSQLLNRGESGISVRHDDLLIDTGT
jgi:hypothetical protein